MTPIIKTKTSYAFHGEHRIRTVDTYQDGEWVREDIELSTPADELLLVPDALEPYAAGRYG
jgi:hypothetical protein